MATVDPRFSTNVFIGREPPPERLVATAKVNSELTCALVGLDGAIVEAEVDRASGLPAFTSVGPPDTAGPEACERVRSADQGRSSTRMQP